MKRILILAFAAALVLSAGGCSGESSSLANLKPELKVTVPAGTRLRVALVEGVGTAKNSPGDQFMASLLEPVIVNGKMVLETGTRMRGRVTEVRESGRVDGLASIQLRLTEIVRDDGTDVAISTNPHTAVAATVAMKGKEIRYEPETRLSFTLADAIDISGMT